MANEVVGTGGTEWKDIIIPCKATVHILTKAISASRTETFVPI